MTSPVRLPRCFVIGVVTVSLFAALPAVASATDYCVVPNAGCGGTNVDTFEKALELAKTEPDADRIFLGAWNYVAPTTTYYAPVTTYYGGTVYGSTVVTPAYESPVVLGRSAYGTLRPYVPGQPVRNTLRFTLP